MDAAQILIHKPLSVESCKSVLKQSWLTSRGSLCGKPHTSLRHFYAKDSSKIELISYRKNWVCSANMIIIPYDNLLQRNLSHSLFTNRTRPMYYQWNHLK